jgi:hypothetical protein
MKHIDTIPADYLEEEAEATETEIAERIATLDAPLNLRISRRLDAALRRRAAREQIPVSSLVRRLLAEGLEQPSTIDVATIEAIARRVVREELDSKQHESQTNALRK